MNECIWGRALLKGCVVVGQTHSCWVDTFLFQRSVNEYLMSSFLQSLPLDPEVKAEITKLLEHVDVYRKAFGYPMH